MRAFEAVSLALGLLLLFWANKRKHSMPKVHSMILPFQDQTNMYESQQVTERLSLFESVWNRSFHADMKTRETVRHLYDIAADTQDALVALQQTFSNDLQRDVDFQALVERVRDNQTAKIEDLKLRCGSPLLFPRLIDDMHYKKWWRAANDVQEEEGAGI